MKKIHRSSWCLLTPTTPISDDGHPGTPRCQNCPFHTVFKFRQSDAKSCYHNMFSLSLSSSAVEATCVQRMGLQSVQQDITILRQSSHPSSYHPLELSNKLDASSRAMPEGACNSPMQPVGVVEAGTGTTARPPEVGGMSWRCSW